MIVLNLKKGQNEIQLFTEKKGLRIPNEVAEMCQAAGVELNVQRISKPKHIDLAEVAAKKAEAKAAREKEAKKTNKAEKSEPQTGKTS